MKKSFIEWTWHLTNQIERVIAIDGRRVRGSGDSASELDAIYTVSAFAADNELILA